MRINWLLEIYDKEYCTSYLQIIFISKWCYVFISVIFIINLCVFMSTYANVYMYT